MGGLTGAAADGGRCNSKPPRLSANPLAVRSPGMEKDMTGDTPKSRLCSGRCGFRVLAVALCLSGTFQKVAAADAGWVLWARWNAVLEEDQAHKQVPLTVAQNPIWEPRDGFDQYLDCRREAAASLRRAGSTVTATQEAIKKNPALEKTFRELGTLAVGGMASDDRVTMMLPIAGGGTRLVEMTVACFPGAFDPRPR